MRKTRLLLAIVLVGVIALPSIPSALAQPTLVQTPGFVASTTDSASDTFASPVTKGHVLAATCLVGVFSGTPTITVTDTESNIWAFESKHASAALLAEMFAGDAKASGADTVTCTASGAPVAEVDLDVFEVSGVINSPIATAGAAGTESTMTTNKIVYPSGSFLLAIGKIAGGGTCTAGTGFTGTGGGGTNVEWSTTGVGNPTDFPASCANSGSFVRVGAAFSPIATQVNSQVFAGWQGSTPFGAIATAIAKWKVAGTCQPTLTYPTDLREHLILTGPPLSGHTVLVKTDVFTEVHCAKGSSAPTLSAMIDYYGNDGIFQGESVPLTIGLGNAISVKVSASSTNVVKTVFADTTTGLSTTFSATVSGGSQFNTYFAAISGISSCSPTSCTTGLTQFTKITFSDLYATITGGYKTPIFALSDQVQNTLVDQTNAVVAVSHLELIKALAACEFQDLRTN